MQRVRSPSVSEATVVRVVRSPNVSAGFRGQKHPSSREMTAGALPYGRATDTWATDPTYGLKPNYPTAIIRGNTHILAKMKRDYIDFQSRTEPLAYFISFRCYGTWVHGDKRFSVNRRSNNIYGTPKRMQNEALERTERELLRNGPVSLNAKMRKAVEDTVREVCRFRDYKLFALNVRTNHVHLVIGAGRKPEFLMTSMKSFCTRKLRNNGLVPKDSKIWYRHGSTRYLWTERHIEISIDYVLNGQGGELPDFDAECQ